jgi:hypothetical protein
MFTTLVTKPSLILFRVGLVAGALDVLNKFVGKPLYNSTVKRLQKIFAMTRATLFMSPQDDNIYCPHPKDYMILDKKGAWKQIKEWASKVVLSASANVSTANSNAINRYFNYSLDDKRVFSNNCAYTLMGSTIWDIFHEMSLRHPGWVYGTRPYGTAFRYTMFFGVPSQRYWQGPGSVEFIDRMTLLYKILKDDKINDSEALSAFSLETMDRLKDTASYLAGKSGGKIEDELAKLVKAKVQGEYLKGMNIRFVPFRRHHNISSNRELIWNGIMSSENAMYNGVSVTYREEDSSIDLPAYGNALFKAHAFIPESTLRILPLEVYPNCVSYEMAMRYGMGSLLHTVRDMYRGEILVTGNPRIRPWDVCILTDDYNDMVGPIEVEQVVHNFSHETGFITEIKPSAIVIGNEISSWPLIEAAKIWSLAVRSQEEKSKQAIAQAASLQLFMLGSGDLAEVLTNTLSPYDNQRLQEKTNALFPLKNGQEGMNEIPIIQDLNPDKDFAQSLQAWDNTIYNIVQGLGQTGAALLGGTASAGVAALGGSYILSSGKVANILSMARIPKASPIGIMALGGIAAVGGAVISANIAGSILTPPTLRGLLGGTVLFLHCMKNETIIAVPLTKNGRPIVSGLSIKDPSVLWTQFKGNLNRITDDAFKGTEDMLRLWGEFGLDSWKKLSR